MRHKPPPVGTAYVTRPGPTTPRQLAGVSDAPADADGLLDRYRGVRSASEALCEPLETEDYVIQTMRDVSPTKWHLAHTSWFFETLILAEYLSGYRPLNPDYRFLFNSYYNTVGEQFRRDHRGVLSRPTVRDVFEYRRHVDENMLRLLSEPPDKQYPDVAMLTTIGLHHEQQHQELMLSDIKHVLASNPLCPAYRRDLPAPSGTACGLRWHGVAGGVHDIGHAGDRFAYDNETPRHQVFLRDFEIASRMVTNREYLAFMEDGGYANAQLWLSDAWQTVQERGWNAPLYWQKRDGGRRVMTLGGLRELNPDEPVCHVSFYEADAFARWAGARLPTEAEWEVAASAGPIEGNFVEQGFLHPIPEAASEADSAPSDGRLRMFGNAWEWTASPYVSYPGYTPPAGALGEYNAKFMCNQMVLRGGSCATPRSHVRRTYRNFFPPDARWQFMGFRLARDA